MTVSLHRCRTRTAPRLVNTLRKRRLRLERFEDRVQPAVFAVTNIMDAGPGSLRNAIDAANALAGPDIIDMATVSGAISLLTALPNVSDRVDINGPGAATLSLERDIGAAANFRVFTLGGVVSISGLTIRNGNEVNGGGIYIQGRLTLTDCVVTGNQALTAGGGVFVDQAGMLTLNNTTLSANTAFGSGGTGGGAVFLQGGTGNPPKLVMTNSVITSNSAPNGVGGGLHARADAIMQIQNSVISNNVAGVNAAFGSGGGGVYFQSRGFLEMNNSTVSGNSATGFGGGMYIYTAVAAVNRANWVIRSSTIANNTTTTTGGGIALIGGGNRLTVEGCTISGNTAATGGGLGDDAVATSVDSVTLRSTVIAGNIATTGADVSTSKAMEAQNCAFGDFVGFTLTGTSMNNLGPMPFVDFKLGPLQNNGGSTETMVPAADSPLVDKGLNVQVRGVDQRGRSRNVDDPLVTNVGDATDIGATEAAPEALAGAILTVHSFQTNGAASYKLQVTYTDNTKVKVSSITTADLTITGPSAIMVTGVTTSPGSDAGTVVATYTLAPADNSWDPADNGTYTVSSVAGEVMDDAGNGITAGHLGQFIAVSPPQLLVVNTTADSGPGSLRQAILDANASIGTNDTISFAIGTGQQTITPTSALPFITDPVTIDGTTQTGYDTITFTPLIRLVGTSAGAGQSGLKVQAGNTTIRGLIISNFNQAGIILEGAGGNTIQNCWLGLNATGTGAAANALRGMYIHLSDNNQIGGATVQSRNVISGNTNDGISIFAGNSNKVEGNYIGSNVAGTLGVANTLGGVVFARGAGYNRVASNLISGNGTQGVLGTDLGSIRNLIQSNLIGTNAAGTGSIGQGQDGVQFQATSDRNIVGVDGDGVNDANEGNVIVGSGSIGFGYAVEITTANDNRVAGNIMGLNKAGTAKLTNFDEGIVMHNGSQRNFIGTNGDGVSDALEGNVISGTGSFAIIIARANTINNVVAGNLIGTTADGKTLIGNGSRCVWIFDQAQFNIIGTNGDGVSDDLEGNVLVGSGNDGVTIHDATAQFNTIAGNFIGVDKTGTVAMPNILQGIAMYAGATNNTIGGVLPAQRNVISGNIQSGIYIADAATTFNTIIGNYIGTTGDGKSALPNGQAGIRIFAGANNIRVGTDGDGINDAAEGNLISGNNTYGVLFESTGTSSNIVAGNRIGTDVTGTSAVPNNIDGVRVTDGVLAITIGGSAPAAANTIAFNNNAGVAVVGNNATSISIRGNSIFGNAGQGIDLGDDGVTANDPLDADIGPNGFLNYPTITGLKTGATTMVSGSYQGAANSMFTLDFYASPTGSTGGEGKRFLGSAAVNTDALGDATFTDAPLAATTAGEVVTATAVDTLNNTSELSAAFSNLGAAKVASVKIDDGSAQRSLVRSLTVTFDQKIDSPLDPTAFVLTRQGGGAVTIAAALDVTGKIATLTFIGGDVDFASLKNGRYNFSINAAKVTTGGGTVQLDGDGDGTPGGNYVLNSAASPAPPTNVWRLFGDSDGDNDVDTTDFAQFRLSYGGGASIFDFDNDGDTDTSDFGNFRADFGVSV